MASSAGTIHGLSVKRHPTRVRMRGWFWSPSYFDLGCKDSIIRRCRYRMAHIALETNRFASSHAQVCSQSTVALASRSQVPGGWAPTYETNFAFVVVTGHRTSWEVLFVTTHPLTQHSIRHLRDHRFIEWPELRLWRCWPHFPTLHTPNHT